MNHLQRFAVDGCTYFETVSLPVPLTWMEWMKASWCIARHTLGGRKGRTILLILAVMMGAALTASLSTGMRSLQASIEYRITKKIGKTDARVVHRYSGTFESDILDDISEWPGVAEASARLTGSLTLARTDGKTDENGRRLRLTARARGVDVENDEDFEQIDLLEGRLPRTTDEILIDPLTAKLLQVNLGDELVVERFGPPIKLKIVGLRDRQIIGALQKPSVQVDRSVISEAVGRSAKISTISRQSSLIASASASLSCAILSRISCDCRSCASRGRPKLPVHGQADTCEVVRVEHQETEP